MIAHLAIGIAAGGASALMFASTVSGSLIALLLLYLAPLPLIVACLGWGPLSAAIGGILASIGIGLLFSMPYLAIFAITVALPAWWLGHLVLLGRQVAEPNAPDGTVVEWYPLGRLLLWVVGFASVTTSIAMLSIGADAELLNATLTRAIEPLFTRQPGAISTADQAALVGMMVSLVPIIATIGSFMTLIANLWLGSRIAAASGQLKRPWPDLRMTVLPPMTLAAVALAVAISMMGGLVGILGKIVATGLLMAYVMAGAATMHILTSRLRNRGLWLVSFYIPVMFFGWPVIVLACLGLADALFGFRMRYLNAAASKPSNQP